MTWSINYSKSSNKFLEKQPQIKNEIFDEINKFIRKLNGETVNINFKKLTGDWDGFYRIRKGKIRIVVKVNKSESAVIIFDIDFRGSIYK